MSIINWLLKGDVSVAYQVHRDLLEANNEVVESFQKRIEKEGFGYAFLNVRENNHIGFGIYSPKWISLHYTLFDLYCIGVSPLNQDYVNNAEFLLEQLWFNNGVVRKNRQQDVCICGMLLSMCCYAKIEHHKIEEIIDYLIDVQYQDGGWNCMHHLGHTHSSLHTTLSVLEGLNEYVKNGYLYKKEMVQNMVPKAQELLLRKELFKRETTKTVIRESFLNCPFPYRWYYDILRALDYFRNVSYPLDSRMSDALDIVESSQKSGYFKKFSKIGGRTHFSMDDAKEGSRWNTVRGLRVLQYYRPASYQNIIK